MDKYMKAAVMTKLRKIEFVECEVPQPGENEVLVKIEYVGVCGSDLHYFDNGRIGDFVVKPPFILGHEASGKVVQVGKDVKELRVGDRVALEPGKTCGVCQFCKSGRYNLCPEVEFFATPPINGVLQEYVCHEASLCFKLPNHVDTLEGALIEPLAVGMHAAKQSQAEMGQTAVVMGAGCIGLATLLALKARGVSQIMVVDVIEKRLQKAQALGADVIIHGKEEDVEKEVLKLTQNNGIDIIIETTGSETALQAAFKIAKKGACIVLVGYYGTEKVNVPLNQALDKELDIKTVFRYRNVYRSAIQAVASGSINIKEIVTNIYPFEELQKALGESIECKEQIVKSVLSFK